MKASFIDLYLKNHGILAHRSYETRPVADKIAAYGDFLRSTSHRTRPTRLRQHGKQARHLPRYARLPVIDLHHTVKVSKGAQCHCLNASARWSGHASAQMRCLAMRERLRTTKEREEYVYLGGQKIAVVYSSITAQQGIAHQISSTTGDRVSRLVLSSFGGLLRCDS